MSGDSRLEGMPVLPVSGGEDYAAGSPGYDPSLPDHLVSLYMRGLLEPDAGIFREDYLDAVAASFRTEMEKTPVSDPNSLIDAVVQLLASETSPEESMDTNTLLDPLVQALYDMGHDNLIVDLDPLPAFFQACATYLHGTEERPLTATYVGSALSIAHWTHWCRLDITGSAWTLGHKAHHISIIYHGRCGSVGWAASDSEFELRGRRALINPYENNGCVFRTEEDLTEHDLSELRKEGFFNRGNTLLVPDGAGGWKEVRP